VDPFSTSIATGLATGFIERFGRRMFDQTRPGARLKVRLGLSDEQTRDDFSKLLFQVHEIYFTKLHPDRQYKAFYDFFQTREVYEVIFDFIFDLKPIDHSGLEASLRESMGRDWVLFSILEQKGLTLETIIKDFVACYMEQEKLAIGLPSMAVIRAVHEETERLLKRLDESLANQEAGYQVNLEELPITSLFDLKPIQESGVNIYYHNENLDEFFVKVHFNLWTRYAIEIINIDLSYPAGGVGHRPKISIDQLGNTFEEVDSAYRMVQRRRVEAGSITNIFVSQTFLGWSRDYSIVTVAIELASQAWNGIKTLRAKGNLRPGGRWEVQDLSLL
jgi:hypothetical protein